MRHAMASADNSMAVPTDERDPARFLDDLRSSDPAIRAGAWRASRQLGPTMILLLGDQMASDDRATAKAARLSLENIVHACARPGSGQAARSAASALTALAAPDRPIAVRKEAIHLLGYIGDRLAVPALAGWLQEVAVQDEARMALEQIPGRSSVVALRQALPAASPEFAAALRQSIRNRTGRPVRG